MFIRLPATLLKVTDFKNHLPPQVAALYNTTGTWIINRYTSVPKIDLTTDWIHTCSCILYLLYFTELYITDAIKTTADTELFCLPGV